jgi:stage V sporulation protein AB
MRQLLFLILGFGAGFAVSAGIFALITALSLIPTMADKTHTASYAQTYETCVFWGGMVGMALYFLNQYDCPFALYPLCAAYLGQSLLSRIVLLWSPLIVSGIFTGIFVGTLAISLAENLDVTAVLGRRLRLRAGIAYVVLSFALGKIAGGFLFFYYRFF